MAGRALAAILGSMIILTAGPAAAQTPVLPDTPAGRGVRAWLDAMNDPDPQAIARLDPRGAPLKAESGGFDLIAVEAADAAQLTAVLRERLSGRYLRATWTFEPGDPPKLKGLRGQPIAAPPGTPTPQRLDDEALAGFITEQMEKTDFSGAVLVARGGKPVFTAVRGLADREANIPNTLQSRFRVGSMNKMFTAVAILQLVQAGKVKLDAPVGAYLSDYPNAEVARSVTVWHLLTHTGGVGDIFGPQFDARRLELKSHQDYVALYGARGPEFTPGTRHKYANYGFILLGRIIEAASGQSYADYVRDRIFEPAGMTNSGFEPETVAVEGRTRGYIPGPDGYRDNAETLPYSGTAAGGGYATVGDLLAFANALTAHQLLDAPHTRLLTTRKVNGFYAFGFGDRSTSALRLYGHNGGAPGMNGELQIVGDGQAVVVALSNVAPPGRATQLVQMILQRATFRGSDGKAADLPPGPPGPPTDAARMTAFKAADRDGDGRLGRAEFRAMLEDLGYAERFERQFSERDADHDGFVTAAEAAPPLS
jgi:CubicO group peptidase (beta-lactamase class C family)